MNLPQEQAKGLFFIADPHVADTPPGQRLPGYRVQVMAKLKACLERAEQTGMLPVILGDLFNWPRDNSNTLLVELIGLFREVRPWVLVGNHDKYQARLTSDVSLSVLEAAGAVRLMKEVGPQFVVQTPQGQALVCASPDATAIPRKFDRAQNELDASNTPDVTNKATTPEKVLWLTHHNIQFPEFLDHAQRIREIPGVDWLVNGHIHRPQPTTRKGQTTWANPGNITRMIFSAHSLERVPAAAVWTWDCEELERWAVPHLEFYEVFPRQEFPPQGEAGEDGESRFLEGLERLAWRRTQEGTGLKQFLDANLNPDLPETRLIRELYEEVIREQE